MKWSINLLISAYSQGYFPMPDPREVAKILWFRPDPRAIIPLDGFHVSRSLRRRIRQAKYTVSFDGCFLEVMKKCADRPETWINEVFLKSYVELHLEGCAHSVEIWHQQKLVGGVYGVSLGGAFFAESMFHTQTDCSKLALYHLVEQMNACGYKLLECQFLTPHLSSLGAVEISDTDYLCILQDALGMHPSVFGSIQTQKY
ncbi:MAG: leucyl/phenylalanyl-tRNA--protein transferase [Zetaproteobacteria bacterium]|nr:leucyl/phenylalanyl-tRNA--protein transferase [Zetaproteobacteria bacterium]